MKSRTVLVLAVLVPFTLFATRPTTSAAGEYDEHFSALGKLSIEVAQAMPADHYSFKPHPESMDYGQLMAHIAITNYQFCAGLKDAATPTLASPADKAGIVKLLGDSFDYCSGVIPTLTEPQLNSPHNSPDGRLLGREILLAMYVHVAHHRGQAEIYLRDNGIRPPSYRI